MRHVVSGYSTRYGPEAQDIQLGCTLGRIETNCGPCVDAEPRVAKGLLRRAKDRDEGIQPERVDQVERVVGDVGVEIDVPTFESDGILGDESLERGVVVARPRVTPTRESSERIDVGPMRALTISGAANPRRRLSPPVVPSKVEAAGLISSTQLLQNRIRI